MIILETNKSRAKDLVEEGEEKDQIEIEVKNPRKSKSNTDDFFDKVKTVSDTAQSEGKILDSLMGDKDWEELLPDSVEVFQPLLDKGFSQPSRVQCETLPLLIGPNPKSVLVQSQTGSGKTIAFLLSILQKIDPSQNFPQAVYAAPTRELVHQTQSVFEGLTESKPVTSSFCLSGGENPDPTSQVIFGTPASLLFFSKEREEEKRKTQKEGILDLFQIKIIIIDEADSIFDQYGSHSQKMTKLLKSRLPDKVLLGCFSATFSLNVRTYINKLYPDIVQFIQKITTQPVVQ